MPAAHEFAALEFVGFAPSLQPLRVNAATVCTVLSMRTRSRVGPVPRRTLPVARRLRPVGLEDGVASSNVVVFRFTITRGRIVAIEMVADPECIREIDLTILGE